MVRDLQEIDTHQGIQGSELLKRQLGTYQDFQENQSYELAKCKPNKEGKHGCGNTGVKLNP